MLRLCATVAESSNVAAEGEGDAPEGTDTLEAKDQHEELVSFSGQSVKQHN